jgi:phenylalanyl-tRNA synthetase beta chain
MKISLNWLKDYVEIPSKHSPKELGDLFTMKTAEVEGIENQKEALDKIIVGQVLKVNDHPDADKLKVVETSVGKEVLQIVCGGTNLKDGMFVAVALIGAKVKWHGEGDLVEMKKVKIRGVESSGMICASSEIDLGECADKEILDLTPYSPKAGQSVAELFGKDDLILDIDNKSLTHRPDLWGHYGIAREFSALLDTEFKKLDPKADIPDKGDKVKIEIKNNELCPQYCGVIMDNIKVGPSPDWIKKRVEAAGIRSINNIVDITNFILSELGQPLHAFDKTLIDGGIVIRNANEGEVMKTLDGEERKLSGDMLVIADHKKPVAIAGIMGGENSEVADSTTSIIIESANFQAANVRRTSQKLGLRTESAQRFEKSLDPCLTELAILRACELILEVCPEASVAGPITKAGTYKKKEPTIDLSIERIHSKIGAKVPEKDILKYFKKLEFEVEKADDILKVKVPSFRANKDVETEDDLIEEIARLHGYDEIEPILPSLPIQLPKENTERVQKHKLRKILSYGLGFSEVQNYSFYSVEDFAKCGLGEDSHFTMENYLSADQSHLRISLAPNLLKAIAKNLRFQDNLKMYEIGRTYLNIKEYFPVEEKKIIGAVVYKKYKGEVFQDAKGALETLLERYGAPALETSKDSSVCSYAHPAKFSHYTNDGEEIARVFELHPQVAKNFDLEGIKIGIFEVNFSKLTKLTKPEKKYKKIPKFPSIDFDISVIIDKEKEAAEIGKIIKDSEAELITSIELFDIYEGEKVEADKKAMAFRITLQAEDRTLTDEEMAKAQNKIFQNLQGFGGKIRGLNE